MVYSWDAHHQTCYQLYIQEGKSLEDIMDHLKSVHKFTPSKRAFQSQFRRWNFPSKQRPAHKNDRLVSRVKELWEKNLTQQEMLRVLTEEDGFKIKRRELMRVRVMNRWLLRTPNGDRSNVSEEDDHQTGEETQTSTVEPGSSSSTPEMQQDSSHREDGVKISKGRQKLGTSATKQTGASGRFPSEMTLDEARIILGLDVPMYRNLRSHFQQICQDEGIYKKTAAGPERWDAVKTQLVRQMPQLQNSAWSTLETPDSPQRALDVICTDVTKRMRVNETRMTLTEAKNVLGINPEQSREMRLTFHQVLADSGFTCKSDATPQQWENLKQTWRVKSAVVRQILTDVNEAQARALDVMTKDITKRLRDERIRKGLKRQPQSQQLPLSPAASPYAGQRSSAAKMTAHNSPPNDQLDLGEGMASSNFDTVSEVSHASQMAFSPANSTMGAHLPMSLQSQTSALSDSPDGLPQPPRVLASSPMPAGMTLGPQMSSSLLLGPNGQATFMDESYVQQQFGPGATSAPVYQQVHPESTACAIYMRLHPSSSLVSSTSLWIATINSRSVQELRQVAADKFPGTVCVRVEGILKDGKGGELPLQIEQDEELSAYLVHLQGAAPTFNMQLMVWKTS